jgi:anti-sigma factor RsiW
MIAPLYRLSLRWGHARPLTLSRYLEGELGRSERLALEAHLGGCPECRALRESLRATVRALECLRPDIRPGVADSVIAALRASGSSPDLAQVASARRWGSAGLTVVAEAGRPIESAVTRPARSSLRRSASALLAYCLRRPQLRLTLPLGLLVGAALSLINQGYMIFDGRVDVGMCAVCALNFVIPFIALNIGLLLATRAMRRRRL